jgi:hypothetical protein
MAVLGKKKEKKSKKRQKVLKKWSKSCQTFRPSFWVCNLTRKEKLQTNPSLPHKTLTSPSAQPSTIQSKKLQTDPSLPPKAPKHHPK